MSPLSRFLIPHSSFLTGKSLLAFSHGLDSTALFHLLLEAEIPFDIAMVNYGLREQAEAEEEAARELAKRHGLRAHIVRAPKWEGNFEAEARKFRYEFFESLIDEHGYGNLLTAHQLDDRLEWLLMRLVRGAGAVELAGMEPVTTRRTGEGRAYRLIRPLLERSKSEIRSWLEERGLTWFDDVSNAETIHERNRFRREISTKLLADHAEGIRRTFAYLRADSDRLLEDFERITTLGELRVVRVRHPSAFARAADRTLKELGYLLSSKERLLIAEKSSVVVGRRWAVERQGGLLYIAPYLRNGDQTGRSADKIPMPKAFRESCRHAGVPSKIRLYLYREGIDPRILPVVEPDPEERFSISGADPGLKTSDSP